MPNQTNFSILRTSLTCCLLLLSFSLSVNNTFAQGTPQPQYHLIYGNSIVQAKNYYLLTLFEQLPEVNRLLQTDTVFKNMSLRKTDSLTAALKNCGRSGACYIDHLKFTDAEIELAGNQLKKLYQPSNALGKLVKEHLVPSGTYILFQQLPPADMLVKAWQQDAEGVNYAIDVYAAGKKPNYPNIDSISFNTRDPLNNNEFRSQYVNLLDHSASLIAAECRLHPAFFSIPLTAALHFIEINERDQAADYEPMTSGENKAACDKIKTIPWDKYAYSLILVPGAGPDEPAAPLSAEGMIRCRLAALQYRQGAAPFIVVSGGKVHPYKTKYCEAVEMKRFLIEKLHIPASAVIIEPHARHTTTNMRNTVRLMFRYGIPFTKKAMVCTTREQSAWVDHTLVARCVKELNEAPYKPGNRLSETEVEFYPLTDALHINPKEPLDP
jgi:hypothetical protein